MEKYGKTPRFISVFVILFFSIIIFGCAETKMQLRTIPSPEATNKLRVAVFPVSEMTSFGVPYHEYVLNQYRNVARFLDKTGIYEVVAYEDLQAVAGDERQVGWKLRNGDWALARQIANAVFADYILITDRGFHSRNAFSLKITLINAENGKRFAYRGIGSAGQRDEVMHIVRAGYRSIFNDAKHDMLANAIRKGMYLEQDNDGKPDSQAGETALIETAQETDTSPEKKTPLISSPASDVQVVDKSSDENEILEKALSQKITEAGKTNIVVYDFNSSKNLNVVALILTEALREEIFRAGIFNLVSRDNLTRAVEELKLQQSGLADENSAVKIGKWLAANEKVTGRLDLLGNTYTLFAKRTNIESLSIVGAGSLRCLAGKEDELLNQMPALARKLAGQ